MLLGSLHCISDTLRLLIINTEWEKMLLKLSFNQKNAVEGKIIKARLTD